MVCKIDFIELLGRDEEKIKDELLRYNFGDVMGNFLGMAASEKKLFDLLVKGKSKEVKDLFAEDGLKRLFTDDLASKKAMKAALKESSLETSSRSQIRSMNSTFFKGLDTGKARLEKRFTRELHSILLESPIADLNEILYKYWVKNAIPAIDFMMSSSMYSGESKKLEKIREKITDKSTYLNTTEFSLLKHELDAFYRGVLRKNGFVSNAILAVQDFNSPSSEEADSYLRYIITTTMDNLLAETFGHISIKPEFHGLLYSPEEDKYSLKTGSSVATSWSDEDDEVPVDNFVKVAIETLPFYRAANGTTRGGSIDIRTINSWQGRIYQLANDPRLRYIKYELSGGDSSDPLDVFLTQWYNTFGDWTIGQYIKGESTEIYLKDLINMAPQNPVFFIPALYAVMSNDHRIHQELKYSQGSKGLFHISDNHIDSIYSLFKGAFDLSNEKSYISLALKRDASGKAIGFRHSNEGRFPFLSLVAQLNTTEYNGIVGVDMRDGHFRQYSLDNGRANYLNFSMDLAMSLHPSRFGQKSTSSKFEIGESSTYASSITNSGVKLSTYKYEDRNANRQEVQVEIDGTPYKLYNLENDVLEAVYEKFENDILNLFPALGINKDLFLSYRRFCENPRAEKD